MDDPLSAVDAKVSKIIFHDCIRKYLKDKIVVLVTHQLQFCRFSENLIVIDQGNFNFGNFKEIYEKDTKIQETVNAYKEESIYNFFFKKNLFLRSFNNKNKKKKR